MSYSYADFLAMQARTMRARGETVPVDGKTVDEAKLHEEILLDCRNRCWPVIHSRMDMPSTIGVGAPDMLILATDGRLFIIECKGAKGKLSMDQLAWKMLLERNGHTYHVVRSFEEYLNAITDAGKPKA